jgi:cobaltochelatase CobS
MGARAFEVVAKASDAIKKQLEAYAKEQVRQAAEKRAPILIKEGTKLRKIKGVMPPEFKRMVELASARIPVMLVGPAGCGKTFLCEKLAEALDLEFSDQSCSEGMSESVFNGLLLPIDKGGAFKHVSSPFMDRYEDGGVMLLDEIDAGDPNLFTYINKAVANESYTVAQRWTKPKVTKHGDFVLVAAANTFGNGADAMYVGRNQLDAATLDRFKVGLITMDYSHDVEASLADAELCEWAWGIREKINSSKLRRIMSTRVIKDLGIMTKQYKWEREDWEQSYFAGWSDAEKNIVMDDRSGRTPKAILGDT